MTNDQPEIPIADVDTSSADSFPASDPPAWVSMRVGAPSELGENRTLILESNRR